MGNSSRPLVIFHGSGNSKEGFGGCADGFGAAFAAWMKLGDEAEYVAAQYGPDNYIKMLGAATNGVVGRDVYVLDFSFQKDDMLALFDTAKRVVWLDHHKTAFEMWCGGIPNSQSFVEETEARLIVLDNEESGAMLAWEYFHPTTEVPMLIRHIDDYDRWQFQLEGTKEFNKALWSYAPWSFDQWHNILDLTDAETLHDMYLEGAAILRAHNQNVQSVVKGSARECEIVYHIPYGPSGSVDLYCDGPEPLRYSGRAANCPPHLTSDVGHELATQSGTFGLCWTLDKEKPVANCSLRSNGDYDVSAIAKAFGGGGHRNAAGFEVPITQLLGWLV